ncbi:uncharacterized protein LOC141712588 [Apium graveolens]|uniref:uncharacterized protein LOC141712588 n=1 Tax=Apium graveolens TaxID=4045 RepID=UPI003D78E21E
MVKSRGKGKKQNIAGTSEDMGSVVEEKAPVRRRGRPLKISKNDNQVNSEPEKVEEEEESEKTNGVLSDQSIKPQMTVENGRKRRPSRIKESQEMIEDQSGLETKIDSTDSMKPVGFRQIGSRRKNKPRRAAEVGVECW